MPFRSTIAGAAGLALLLAGAPAAAQEANLEAFGAACIAGETFFLPPLPEGVDATLILTPLCACLGTEFSAFPQADVDMLTSDIDGSATDETRTAYGDYDSLRDRAADKLQLCFDSDPVTSAVQAIPELQPDSAPPAEPAAPPTP